MESVRKLGTLIAATIVIWLSMLLVGFVDDSSIVSAAAAILALISTMTIWSMWALDQYGINVDGAPRETAEKAKRDPGSVEDTRLALLLAMLTPEERDSLRDRLAEDLNADGEIMTLAELLADQDQDTLAAG